MEQSTNLPVTGKVNIKVIDKNGTVKSEHNTTNLVVNTGLTYIASRMVGTSATTMTHMAIGTGSTTPAGANTTLATEIQRVTLTSQSATSNTVSYSANFPSTGSSASIVEAGILNAGSGGTLLCRTTFGVVTKAADDSLVITWTITVGA